MRLSIKETNLIKDSVNNVFGETVIYLFGSRADDAKKGGDIDLYLIPKDNDNLFIKKIKIKTVLEEILFKPVDIIVAKNKKRLIEIEAMKGIII